jgi:hypothetical protein
MILIEDPEATARTLARRVPGDQSQQRFGNVSRISSARALTLPEKPQDHVEPPPRETAAIFPTRRSSSDPTHKLLDFRNFKNRTHL